MSARRFTERHARWLLAGSFVVAVALAALAAFYFRSAEREGETLDVPLGVEQAAIVTYSGAPLAVTPYKWGVAVNVRIAAMTERPDARIYDVRYIVNRAGTFDLKDYLTAADGSTLSGLPSFHFRGDPKLSKNLDNRIRETEEISVEVGGHYWATLAALAVVWIVWLLLLIFYKRPRPPAPAPAPPAEPTLAEVLRGFLARLEAGTLDAAGKARMEMVLLRRWREELALAGAPMSAAFTAMGENAKTGETLRKLEHWIHHRASPVTSSEIAAVIAPYTFEVPTPAPGVQA
jgi:hypothetical protein